MRAYKIAIGVIAFQLSIPVASAIGIAGPLGGFTVGSLLTASLTSWHAWINLSAIGLGGAAARILSLRVPIGALVMAGAFTVSSIGLNGVLAQLVSTGFLLPQIHTLITGIISPVFLFAFVQASSSAGKGSY